MEPAQEFLYLSRLVAQAYALLHRINESGYPLDRRTHAHRRAASRALRRQAALAQFDFDMAHDY